MTFSFNPIIKQPIKYFSPVLLPKTIIISFVFSENISLYFDISNGGIIIFARVKILFKSFHERFSTVFLQVLYDIYTHSMYDLRVICFLLLFNLRILNYLSCTQLMILPHNRTLVMIMVLIEL